MDPPIREKVEVQALRFNTIRSLMVSAEFAEKAEHTQLRPPWANSVQTGSPWHESREHRDRRVA